MVETSARRCREMGQDTIQGDALLGEDGRDFLDRGVGMRGWCRGDLEYRCVR